MIQLESTNILRLKREINVTFRDYAFAMRSDVASRARPGARLCRYIKTNKLGEVTQTKSLLTRLQAIKSLSMYGE